MKKSKQTLRYRFTVSLIVYTSIILVLWFGYHLITHQAVSRSERENAILAADSLLRQISAEFTQMNTITSIIAGSGLVQDFMMEENNVLYYEKAATVSEIIRRIAFPISSADSVITVSENGKFFRFSGGISNSGLHTLAETFQGAGRVYTVIELDNKLFFCHSTPVIDYSGQNPIRKGNVIILTGLERIRRMLGYGDDVDRAVVIDGVVILSNNPALEGLTIENIERYYGVVSSAPITGTSLTVVAAIPADLLFPERILFFVIAFTTLGLLLIVIMLLYRDQSRHMIMPMTNIIKHVRRISGDKQGRLPETNQYEFDELVADINEMLDRIEEYNEALGVERQKVFDTELIRKNMRISLLASQMDAHFVVNTLKNIKRLSDLNETEKAGEMAEGLAAILKHQHSGDALVNIFDDFQILGKYVDIMNTKFENKFQVEYDVDDKLETYKMPGLILQPLVENALSHGLQNKEFDARMVIKGYLQGGKIVFEISDNGCGISPEKLTEIQENLIIAELSDFPSPGLRGVALSNIQRRIHIRFGEGYGIGISSTLGEGTTVTVTLPVILDG